MTTAINDITKDNICTKNVSDAYRNNYDSIFRKGKSGESYSIFSKSNNSKLNPENNLEIEKDLQGKEESCIIELPTKY